MVKLPFDTADPHLAWAAWSRLVEPTDNAAIELVRALGPSKALDWVCEPSGAALVSLDAKTIQGIYKGAKRWQGRLDKLDIRRELHAIKALGGWIITPSDANWPKCLADLAWPPFCLWGRGNPDQLQQLSLALVGSRACTNYGQWVASELAGGLGSKGVSIISGGAYGVDAAAHRAALATGTLCVCAGGVDYLYPSGNEQLLRQICIQGALISEVPPGCAPARHRFLTRNRLIAALSSATVVVEASWRSGAISTANHALELGRALGAVPGQVTSFSSAGCHRLIRQGAVCITDADEAYELLTPLGQFFPEVAKQEKARIEQPGLLDGLDPLSSRVYDSLPRRACASVDSLVQVSGLDAAAVLAALGQLQLAGKVKALGGAYKRA